MFMMLKTNSASVGLLEDDSFHIFIRDFVVKHINVSDSGNISIMY